MPVKAVFHFESCHFSYTCESDDAIFRIEIPGQKIENPTVTPWPSSSSTICTVSGNVTTKKPINDVQFFAHLTADLSPCWDNQILCCEDHIIVKGNAVP